MARIEEIRLSPGATLRGYAALGRSLGELPDVAYSETARRWALHAVALFAVNLGGALVGYLSAGNGFGALVGANASTALWGLGQGIAGTQLTRPERAGFIATGLLSTASTGYLFLRRKRR